ncbi:hypothetical protein SIN01_09340 [Sporolactobacillus inulinus]|nr:hypothetical protein SIN01_09340 [Sporolactobacillus inulinus]
MFVLAAWFGDAKSGLYVIPANLYAATTECSARQTHVLPP